LTSIGLRTVGAHGSDLDYAYQSAPQVGLNDRSLYCLAGRTLSGGTATNYGTWIRGSAVDDKWSKVGWRSTLELQRHAPVLSQDRTHHDPDADVTQHGFGRPFMSSLLRGFTLVINSFLIKSSLL